MKTILVDALDTFVIEGEGINQELYTLLKTYPNPKVILTNANEEQMVQFGIVNMPYPVFTLSHNPDKPNPVYFETFFKENNLSANEVVYFEHNSDACESAESLGITTHFYDMDKRDLDALKEFLDNNL